MRSSTRQSAGVLQQVRRFLCASSAKWVCRLCGIASPISGRFPVICCHTATDCTDSDRSSATASSYRRRICCTAAGIRSSFYAGGSAFRAGFRLRRSAAAKEKVVDSAFDWSSCCLCFRRWGTGMAGCHSAEAGSRIQHTRAGIGDADGSRISAAGCAIRAYGHRIGCYHIEYAADGNAAGLAADAAAFGRMV